MIQPNEQKIDQHLRLKQVLEIIPVSRSTWYRGINAGIYPKPVKLSTRTSAWRLHEIKSHIEKLNSAT